MDNNKNDEAQKERISRLCKQKDTLDAAKQTLMSHLQEIADYVVPNKNDVTRKTVQQGEKKFEKLVDSTAVHANELLASALHSMLTSAANQFFTLTTGDYRKDNLDANRRWLHNSAKRMHEVLNFSNFQTEIHEHYIDLGAFGTAILSMEEDDKFIVRFNSRPIAECAIAENYQGIVDTNYREFKKSIRNVVQEWGSEGLPDKLKSMLEKNPQEEITVIHAVYPKDEDTIKLGPEVKKMFKYASVYFSKEEKHIFHEGEFLEFPYIVSRWSKISGETYGRSPASKALPDIKMLNTMMRTTIRAAQKIVDPPLLAPDDGFVQVNINPGQISYYRSGTQDKIEPIQTGGRIDISLQMMEEVRSRIRSAFFNDQLQVNEGRPMMTATEVNAVSEQNLRLMSPQLGRQNFETLRPLTARLFQIMQRKNMFDPIPEEMKNEKGNAVIQVQYSSQISRVQRESEAMGLNKFFANVSTLIAADPTAMDIIDKDAAMRYYGSIYAIPVEIIRDDSDVKTMRDQRAQQQQQAMDAQKEQQDADLMVKAGQATASQAQAQQAQQGM